jgi:hypothetical protein
VVQAPVKKEKSKQSRCNNLLRPRKGITRNRNAFLFKLCKEIIQSLTWRVKLTDSNGLSSQIIERFDAAIVNRKPALLAMLLVDILKDNGWSPDDVHFLGSEIINESGML